MNVGFTSLLQSHNFLSETQCCCSALEQFCLTRRLATLVFVGDEQLAGDETQDLFGDKFVGEDNVRPASDGLVGSHGEQIWIAWTGADELDLTLTRLCWVCQGELVGRAG